MTLKKYLLSQLWIVISLVLFTMLALRWLPETWQTRGWMWSLMLFYLTGGIFYALYLRVMNKKQHAFANFFLLSTGIKLLTYIAFIVVYLLFNRSEAKSFLLFFLIYYVVFAVFESRVAMKQQKPRGNFQKDSNPS